MGSRINKLKAFISDIRFNYIMQFGIWEEAKECIRDRFNAGEIVDVLSVEKKAYYNAPTGMLEDCSTIQNVNATYTVETSTGSVFIIKQSFYGTMFEDLHNSTELDIYSKDNELLYTTRTQEQRVLSNKGLKQEDK